MSAVFITVLVLVAVGAVIWVITDTKRDRDE